MPKGAKGPPQFKKLSLYIEGILADAFITGYDEAAKSDARKMTDEAEARKREEARLEAQRKEAEARKREEARLEAQRTEAEARKREEARLEAQRKEAEARKREEARLEAQRKEAEARKTEEVRLEAERKQAEARKTEEARLEAERKEARLEAERKEVRLEAERKEAEARKREEIINETRRILSSAHLPSRLLVQHVFQVPPGYSVDQVQRNRRKLVLLLHPDKALHLVKANVDGQAVVDEVNQAYLVQDRAWSFVESENAPAPFPDPPYWYHESWVPPPPPPPAAPRPGRRQAPPGATGQQQWMKICAHGKCNYACTNPRFGGFCCRACYECFVAGEDPEHGGCCLNKTPWYNEMAEPVAPDAPKRPLRRTRIWNC